VDLLTELKSKGQGDGIEYLLSRRHDVPLPDAHPCHDLVSHVFTSDSSIPHRWLMLDRALDCVRKHHADHEAWCQSTLASAWSTAVDQAQGALAELEAFGTLLEVFPNCIPVPRERRSQTPDFTVPGCFNAEVSCPRESRQNREAVQEELDSQQGMVRAAVSHPITGSGGEALRYPANKIVDRLLNAKRKSKQARSGEVNLLVLDVRHEWALSAHDLAPFRTVYSKEMLWVGTFGAWHTFYGAADGRRTMLGDRVAVEFLSLGGRYEQKLNGFFREQSRWSAALMLVSDGTVLLENPWAERPVDDAVLRELLRTHRCRLDYCWHRGGGTVADLASAVERELRKLEWLFSVSPEDENGGPADS
jgi:hypothetical protein